MRRLRDLLEQLLANPDGRKLLAGGCAAALLLGATVAQAATGGGHGGGGAGGDIHINWWTPDMHAPPLGWFIIDFVVFVAALVYFTRGKLRTLFQQRHDTIKNAIADADQAHTRAQAHQQEYHQKLDRVDQEETELTEGARKDGAALRDQIVAAAREYTDGARRDAGASADQDLLDAHTRLRDELVGAVLTSAHALLAKELSDSDRTRLLEQAITSLENDPVAMPSARIAARATGPGGAA